MQKLAPIADVETSARTITVVASDESVDRYGDVVRASGWDLRGFRRNPVLLFAHDTRSLPVGTVTRIAVEKTRLVAVAHLLPEGVNPFVDKLWKTITAGAIRAVSVGFRPTQPPVPIVDSSGDRFSGYEFVGQELLELSIVPIPANRAALIVDKAAAVAPTARLYRPDPVTAFLSARRAELDRLRVGARR